MNIIESILLALALCVDSLVVSTTCGLKTKMKYSRSILLAVTFAVFQGLFPLLGALLGHTCQALIEVVDHWIAFGLLALVSLKMLLDAFKSGDNNGNFDISRFGIICLLAIATSIDAFVVGIGFGISNGNSLSQILLTVSIIAVVTFLSAMLGVFLGKQNVPIPEKWATIIAAIVLFGLGVNTLIEHGVFGFLGW